MKPLLSSFGLATAAALLFTSCDTTRETVSTPPASGTLRSEASGVDTVTSFRRTFTQGATLYQVRTTGEGSMRLLSVGATQNGQPLASLRDTLDGEVQDAALIPPASGSAPAELIVFVQGAGSGSYGQVYGFSLLGNLLQRLPPLPELVGPASKGYQGHDTFRVVGHEVWRTFPIYAPADANCCPSGGQRTVRYTLQSPSQGFRQAGFEQSPTRS
ncbi:hypothetical protein SAMN06265337_1085 [Hymenobacter gelipurpurascens]|uniref:Uncharacterized protein n=1 Tax=Hymenobacter gelipurpurascens TaxID=89968 RepID=A0A212TF48_9BACT|nr:hypothetical protein [Hymenobacter gelipurpurascens]SNC64464.1 hypothetical protein SAMN06265337_1085 [Hymenobacter gelipurpurascens]